MADAPRFAVTIRVMDADIDRQGHVNNVAFLRYIQDAAAAHWTAIAPEDMREAYTWVVRRHEIEYLRPGSPGDELVRAHLGRRTLRRDLGANDRDRPQGRGTTARHARTVWVLLDAATGRPRRIDAELIACLSVPRRN